MRELRIGEEVLGREGERLGTIERLVVDESAHRVTHLVVDGHLVGAGRFRASGPDRLQCDLDPAGLARLPRERTDQLRPAGEHWNPPSGYAVGNFLRVAGAILGQGPYVPPIHLEVDLSAVHEITVGSPVWAGEERLGEVARVLTDDADNLTQLVLHRQGLLGANVLLPAGRVTEVVGNNVHVDLGPDEAARLPAYEPPG